MRSVNFGATNENLLHPPSSVKGSRYTDGNASVATLREHAELRPERSWIHDSGSRVLEHAE
jgi:hypothetical protein